MAKFTYEEVKYYVEVESQSGCKLISDEYTNSLTLMKFLCSCGDSFETRYSSFRNSGKTQCNKCSRENFAAKMRISIEYINNFIKENCEGVELISTSYKNNREKLQFRCFCGNLFYANWDNFSSGRVKRKCEKCVKEDVSNAVRRKWSYDTVKNYIEVESGSGCKLISKEYINDREKLDILCGCNTSYRVSFENFRRAKQFQCPSCGNEKSASLQRYSIEDIHNILKESNSGCKLLSDTYVNCKDNLIFKCSCGSIFENSLDQVMTTFKYKCNECSYREAGLKARLKYKDVKDNIELDGGFVLISNSYTCATDKLEIMCKNNHVFDMDYNNFISRRSCPVCTASESERYVYETLCKIGINIKREKTFDGLLSDLGRPLRFDFAIFDDHELSFLLELDGEQHYRPVNIFGGKDVFETLQIHDKRKNQYCKDNNIPLIRIPYWQFDKIEEILNKWLSKYGLIHKENIKEII